MHQDVDCEYTDTVDISTFISYIDRSSKSREFRCLRTADRPIPVPPSRPRWRPAPLFFHSAPRDDHQRVMALGAPVFRIIDDSRLGRARMHPPCFFLFL